MVVSCVTRSRLDRRLALLFGGLVIVTLSSGLSSLLAGRSWFLAEGSVSLLFLQLLKMLATGEVSRSTIEGSSVKVEDGKANVGPHLEK